MASYESGDEKYHGFENCTMKSDEPSGHHQDSSLESPKKKEVITGESEVKPHIGVTNHDQSVSLDRSSDEESVSDEELKARRKALEEDEKKHQLKKKEKKKARTQKKAGPSSATSNAENFPDNPNTAGPSGATSNAENLPDNQKTAGPSGATSNAEKLPDNQETGSDSEELEEIRILLVGHTGNGKSSTANTIIGKDVFEASASTSSITQNCQMEETIRDNKKIVVIDTPGMFPTTEKTNKNIEQEIRKCVGVCLPGPHVILYVLRIGGKFTKEEEKTINRIDKLFEKSYYNFVIFLFTNKEGLRINTTLDEFLVDMPKSLKRILNKADNRKLAFKNVNLTPDEKQVQLDELFTKIRQLGEKRNVKYYTDSKLTGLANALQKKPDMTREHMRQDIINEGESYDIIREKWYQLCYSPY